MWAMWARERGSMVVGDISRRCGHDVAFGNYHTRHHKTLVVVSSPTRERNSCLSTEYVIAPHIGPLPSTGHDTPHACTAIENHAQVYDLLSVAATHYAATPSCAHTPQNRHTQACVQQGRHTTHRHAHATSECTVCTWRDIPDSSRRLRGRARDSGSTRPAMGPSDAIASRGLPSLPP